MAKFTKRYQLYLQPETPLSHPCRLLALPSQLNVLNWKKKEVWLAESLQRPYPVNSSGGDSTIGFPMV